jgi:Right handed beta helix region
MRHTLRSSLALAVASVLLVSSISLVAQGHRVRVVSPGESIQAAIDQSRDGESVFVLPGVYRETADGTNGLTITRAINLIGLSTPRARVILENSGGQRNGIVVVPSDRTACLTCHATLAPPFDVLPGVAKGLKMREPMIRSVFIQGLTIRGFANNGLFTENVDGFLIDDVESIGNANYGIFPTLSRNGVISRSRVTGSGDTGVWVETSEHVLVTKTLAEGNLVGMEVSNSDDIEFTENESRHNSIGLGLLLLPHLFDDHPGARRLVVRDNDIHSNNRPNDAPPNSLIAGLPSGVGVLALGVDDSVVMENRIGDHELAGVAIVDVCLALAGTRFDCAVNPRVTSEFLADQAATNNRVVGNLLTSNGVSPPPSPFAFAAGYLTLLSFGTGNCFARNSFAKSFSIVGVLPPCP